MFSWLDCSWHVERMYTPAENNTKKGKESSKVALPDCETRVEWPPITPTSSTLYTLSCRSDAVRVLCKKKEDGVCRHSVLAAITYLSSSGISVIKSTDIVKMFWISFSSFLFWVHWHCQELFNQNKKGGREILLRELLRSGAKCSNNWHTWLVRIFKSTSKSNLLLPLPVSDCKSFRFCK